MSPSLVNRYKRTYYLSADKLFRITVDDELSYFNIDNFNTNFNEKFRDESNIIVELKYDKNSENTANLVSQHFPFRITKSSKYITGIDRIYIG
jgi:hypothetical protein